MKKTFEPYASYQPEHFTFSDSYAQHIEEIIAQYPAGHKKSAVMPLLDLAQRQIACEGMEATPPYGGWIPRAAMDHIADILEEPKIKVYEVASFYSMYNTEPVGKYLIQFCTTTPCQLCGCGKLVHACKEHLGIDFGETTGDGKFTMLEVECLGACVNAPVVQINDDYYEDLTADNLREILISLAEDMKPTIGSQTGRRCSMPSAGPTSLKKKAKEAKVI
ncbi:MAG: NADH-quinone oxidoreductase subunit NuoE [Alphaproteobacteria bacterium]